MARKTLLTESELRRFMKLAQLNPAGDKRLEEMGMYPGARDEDEELEDELHATEDELGAEDHVADEEGDELDDLGDEMGGGADEEALLARVVQAVADELDVEVSVEGGEEEVEDVEMDLEEPGLEGGEDELEMDVEEDVPMMEDKDYTAKKEKPGKDKRKGAEKRGAEGTLAKTKGHGRVDYVNEDEDYTAKKEKPGKDKRKGAEKRGAEGTLAKTKGHGRVDYVNEDSGEDEAWHDWKNEHADDDHIKEIEHHLRALRDDRDHDEHGAEYDHDRYEDDGYREGTKGQDAIVNEVAKRVAARLAKENKQEEVVDQLAERIMARLTK